MRDYGCSFPRPSRREERNSHSGEICVLMRICPDCGQIPVARRPSAALARQKRLIVPSWESQTVRVLTCETAQMCPSAVVSESRRLEAEGNKQTFIKSWPFHRLCDWQRREISLLAERWGSHIERPCKTRSWTILCVSLDQTSEAHPPTLPARSPPLQPNESALRLTGDLGETDVHLRTNAETAMEESKCGLT